MLFAYSTSPLPRVLAPQSTDHDKTWTVYAPLLQAESPRCQVLRAVGGPHLQVSLETWDPHPNLDHFLLIGNDLFCIAKIETELGQAPTSYARRPDEDHLWPLNLATRALCTLSSGAYTLPSLVIIRALRGEDSRRHISAVCEKHLLFAVGAGYGTQQEARASCAFPPHHNGGNLFCFTFSDPIIVCLGEDKIGKTSSSVQN